MGGEGGKKWIGCQGALARAGLKLPPGSGKPGPINSRIGSRSARRRYLTTSPSVIVSGSAWSLEEKPGEGRPGTKGRKKYQVRSTSRDWRIRAPSNSGTNGAEFVMDLCKETRKETELRSLFFFFFFFGQRICHITISKYRGQCYAYLRKQRDLADGGFSTNYYYGNYGTYRLQKPEHKLNELRSRPNSMSHMVEAQRNPRRFTFPRSPFVVT